ncbi:MAG: molecular chaperone TorD family protein [Micrococcales bacterium]|nr:molecular chaperone TorD family protein [Micrococcales bacterium]MCL2666405.1 molecular chaperone TorD family protein [Micrococcales bacterium]
MLTADELDRFAAAFTVLGRFHLLPPEEEALTCLDELLDEWPLPATGATAVGLDLMRRSRLHESAVRIRRDHDRLYGRTAKATVAPYESVHRGTDGLVFDVQTLQVRAAYRTLGLRAPEPNKEPDDHIGLELDFLAASCLRALDALDLGLADDAERCWRTGVDFLHDHVLAWAPDVLRTVADKSTTEFMAAVAHLTTGALDAYTTVACEPARP